MNLREQEMDVEQDALIRPKYHYSVTDFILVLDLDETVLHTFSSNPSQIDSLELRKYPQLRDRLYSKEIRVHDRKDTYSISRFWGVKRPHYDTFMTFAATYFQAILIWTAGVFPYGREMTNEITRGLNQERIFMTRRDCTVIDESYVKSARTLANKMGVDPSKLLYLDDRAESFCETPNQGIQIPRYEPAENPSAILLDDPTLLQLRAWLSTEEALQATSVSQLVKPGLFSHSVEYYKRQRAKEIVPRYKVPRITAPQNNEIVLENPYY
jgi:hypothetical protein